MKNLRKRKISTIFSMTMIFVLIFTMSVQAKTKKIYYGTVSGSITWQYNDYVGTKGDQGAKIYLISSKCTKKDFKKVSGTVLGFGEVEKYIKGKVFYAKANGNGDFKINHIPTGKYKVIIVSNKTTRNPDENIKKSYQYKILSKYLKSSEVSDFITCSEMELKKSSWDNVTVYKNDDSDVSYDFGNTYF